MDPIEIDTQQASGKLKHSPPTALLGIIGVGSVIVIGLIVAIVFVSIKPDSPSEAMAKQRKKTMSGSPFAGFANMQKGSIDFSLETSPSPTIEIGAGVQFGEPSASTHVRITTTFRNDSSIPVARVRGKYQLIGDGRSIPYCSGDFFESFSGGVEGGETKSVELIYLLPRMDNLSEQQKKTSHWQIFIEEISSKGSVYSTNQSEINLIEIKAPNAPDPIDLFRGVKF